MALRTTMLWILFLTSVVLGACARAPAAQPTPTPQVVLTPIPTPTPTPSPVPTQLVLSTPTPTPTLTPSPVPPQLVLPTPIPTSIPSQETSPGTALGIVRLVIAPGTEARYRVREQLARLNFPSDAVGTTQQVTGAIVLAGDTLTLQEGSRITVDLRTLRSDESRRDRYIQDNTLETRLYPYAEFVPREVRGLSGSLPTQGEATFQVSGDMTIHGTTRSITWDVTATFSEKEVVGQAKTSFRFGDFNMAIPRVMAVLSVEDNIRLEVDFRLTRQ